MCQWTSVANAQLEKHQEFVNCEKGTRYKKPEEAYWRVKGIQDEEKNIVEVCKIEHLKESFSSYEREGPTEHYNCKSKR